jgi:hypothetical protein
LALLLACNGPEPAVEDPSTVAWMIGKRRQRMKVVAEGAVSSLLQMASVESDQAHLEFEEELAEVEMGVELGIVDPLLEPYGLNDRERFRAQIEKIEHKYAERLAASWSRPPTRKPDRVTETSMTWRPVLSARSSIAPTSREFINRLS